MKWVDRRRKLCLCSFGMLLTSGCGGQTAHPPAPIVHPLPFHVVTPKNVNGTAADYSLALDRLVLVSDDDNAVHLLDGRTLADRAIALPQAPEYVSISPDGLHAAVCHQHAVSYVDLSAGRVVGTYPTEPTYPTPWSLAVGNDGYIYGASGQALFAIDTGTGALISPLLTGGLAQVDGVRLGPDGTVLWACTDQGMQRIAVHGSQATLAPSSGHGTTCSSLFWRSRYGARLYDGLSVYDASDLSILVYYLGKGASWVDDPEGGRPIAAIGSMQGGDALQLFDPRVVAHPPDASEIDPESSTPLPSMNTGSGTSPTQGLAVFYDTAGTTRFVLVRAIDTRKDGIVAM